ncbi:hypothetical protein niasHT_015974 [Heterodera trifolii]|uniref:FLYWCH-type domain-containing protein n=1 Tax=Heterodera trifolii TaxID=157864 RepID=A0ABD2KUP3_9BILA
MSGRKSRGRKCLDRKCRDTKGNTIDGETGQLRLASCVWPIASGQLRLGPVASWPVASGQLRLASCVLVLKGPVASQTFGCLYVFHMFNADRDVKFWRCEHQRDEFKCRGRIHTTLNDVVLKTVGDHTCNHSAANVITQKIVTGIKRRAAETMEPPAAIRAHTLQQIATPVMANIPTKNATKKLVKRVRHEIELPPPVPQPFKSWNLPSSTESTNAPKKRRSFSFLRILEHTPKMGETDNSGVF